MISFSQADEWALLSLYGGMALAISAIYALARLIRNAGVIDVFWGFGLGTLAFLYWMQIPTKMALYWRPGVLALLGVLASLRLGLYLLKRFLREHPVEDARYTAFREQWRPRPELTMFGVYQLQGLLMVTVSLPIWWVCRYSDASFGVLDIAGILVFLLGWALEWLADEQLKHFKHNSANRGKTCQVGLWRFSRHPNYFGEWLMWVGYYLMALAVAGGWITLFSPLLMLLFLTKVTGVAATEAHALKTRPDYAEYQRRTSAFFPWFVKA
jgi:steroid 5-alpha reductase family enzyme